jgi:hypothetical protein
LRASQKNNDPAEPSRVIQIRRRSLEVLDARVEILLFLLGKSEELQFVFARRLPYRLIDLRFFRFGKLGRNVLRDGIHYFFTNAAGEEIHDFIEDGHTSSFEKVRE